MTAEKRKPKRDYRYPPGVEGRLYKAVVEYAESLGGGVVVIGGIEVQQWPGETENHYRVAVRCLGRKPEPKAPSHGRASKGKR